MAPPQIPSPKSRGNTGIMYRISAARISQGQLTTEYQAIAQEAEEDFNQLFGTEFARAYEERLRTPH